MPNLRDVKGVVDIEELKRFVDQTKWIWPYDAGKVLPEHRRRFIALGDPRK